HRDLKPDNLLLEQNGDLLLSDFGIAVIAHTTHSYTTQEIAGTAPYMAPEQFQGHARPASDQYALGIITYEWLCGKCPFHGDFVQLMYQHVQVPPPGLHQQVPAI